MNAHSETQSTQEGLFLMTRFNKYHNKQNYPVILRQVRQTTLFFCLYSILDVHK